METAEADLGGMGLKLNQRDGGRPFKINDIDTDIKFGRGVVLGRGPN